MRSLKIRRTAAVIAAAGFFLMLMIVLGGNAAAVDDPVREAFYSVRSESLTAVVKIITYMGNWQTVTAVCIVLLLVKGTRMTYGVPVSLCAISVSLINKCVKHLVERARPDDIMHLVEEGGFSFASGHSATSMAVCLLLIYLVRKNMQAGKKADILTVLIAIPMLLIGPSRIYVGVHYPTDVIAGWCLGIVVAVIVIEVMEKTERGRYDGKGNKN